MTFLQLLNLDYHAPGGQDDKAAGGANGVDVTYPPLFNLDYYALDEQENGAPGDAYVTEVTYLPPAKLDNNAADGQDNAVDERTGDAVASRMALLTPPLKSRPVMSTSSRLAFPMSGTTPPMMLASRRGMTTAPMAKRVYPVRFQLRD